MRIVNVQTGCVVLLVILATACGGGSTTTSPSTPTPTPTQANPGVDIYLEGGDWGAPSYSYSYSATVDGAATPAPVFTGLNLSGGFSGRLTPGVHELRVTLTKVNFVSVNFRGGAPGNTGGVQPGSVVIFASSLVGGSASAAWTPQNFGCGAGTVNIPGIRAIDGTLVVHFTVILADYTAVCR